VSSEDRRARRRGQLLETGLELFGTRGFRASSVREICLAASLNRRYFYESFATREDLLHAVYDDCVAELGQVLIAAVADQDGIADKARAGMVTFWDWITLDARRARILCIEIIGVSETLEQRRRDARHWFADLVAAQAVAIAEAEGRALRLDATLTSRALVAATIDLVVDWLRDDVDASVAELTEHCIDLYTIAGAAVLFEPGDAKAS